MPPKKIPKKVQRRIELAQLFYPLDHNASRRLARTLNSGLDKVIEKLNDLPLAQNYTQDTPESNLIIWIDKKTKSVECMFCLVPDAADFKQLENLFKKIKKFHPFFTYAFVHQKKEGEGTFDIFRFSRFSYFEHCNRVHAPKKSKPKT